MALAPDDPYGAFNGLLELEGVVDAGAPSAQFAEV
jgi:hypothetical protein